LGSGERILTLQSWDGAAPIEASASAPIAKSGVENRIVALDGLRGLMTILVVVSPYFADVPHGVVALEGGWIAVKMFFALSGFLVGRLILEKMRCANFFAVFYVRRACRTLPVYFFCVVLVFLCMRLFGSPEWMDVAVEFPLWSYLTFTQNFFMISTDSIGPHWLAPTWTLTVEEHFYLFAPALFFITPRRHLLSVLAVGALFSLLFRILAFQGGYFSSMTALALLPGNADALFAGMFAAVLFKTEGVRWERHETLLRVFPIIMLLCAFFLKLYDGDAHALFESFGFFLVSLGCAAFILGLALATPEARRFASPWLCFFGNASYSIYLTHLAILGLMHGLLLGSQPDIANWRQIAVTVAALPIAALVGWIFTKIVEEPITAYGRSWRWSNETRRGAIG
jgi:peptidoglycan/LPS O-acetylase OafA/YrhL